MLFLSETPTTESSICFASNSGLSSEKFRVFPSPIFPRLVPAAPLVVSKALVIICSTLLRTGGWKLRVQSGF